MAAMKEDETRKTGVLCKVCGKWVVQPGQRCGWCGTRASWPHSDADDGEDVGGRPDVGQQETDEEADSPAE